MASEKPVTLPISDSIASWLILAKEKFEESQENLQKEPELLRVGDLNQPFQPYFYKYKARDTFQELLDKLTELLTNAENTEIRNDELEKRFKSLQALFNYFLGVVCCDTDEPSAGEDHFNKALHYLEKNDNLIETCLLSINLKNNLGIIWSERGELDKACNYLCEAEQIYTVSKELLKEPPLSFIELFTFPILDRREKEDLDFGFGKAHVHSLYYLAQVYEKIGEAKLAASYCHKTLKWQMTNKNYNPLEWSLNCATLSQFFVGRERFEIARYLLSCASYVFSSEITKEPEKLEEKELVNHTKSDIARCWVNYALALLSSSREKLSAEKQSIERNIEKMFETLTTDYSKDDYILINQEQVDSWENEITFGYIDTFDEARKVFLLAQKWIKESKIYYKLSERASDYAQIVQNNSTLYDHIAFFESSEETKCKMHKRRVDMLEETLQVLNQKYYLAICQQFLFELGEIYTTMVQLKLAQYDPKNPVPHSVKKINSLVDKGISTFQKLLASMNSPSGEHPERYADEIVRPALLARFYIGQLYSKYIVIGDPAKKLANLQEIEKNYNFVKNYVTKNEEHEDCISSELEVFKEMVELIPCRIQQELSSTLY